MISSVPWLSRFLRLFPTVDAVLAEVTDQATKIPQPQLQYQALQSIDKKAFHCYGGAVMSLLAPASWRSDLVSLIVYLQTISDYLDNLCDRAGSTDAQAFLHLHQAMYDAINPQSNLTDYYARYGLSECVYLPYLVANCQQICQRLTGMPLIKAHLEGLVSYYSYLQAYKHMDPAERECCLQNYINDKVPNPHGLNWWELAAATGSTLGMFALLSLASRDNLKADEIDLTLTTYFPWVCGLHILLDYLIDFEEDLQGGDLNFVAYYDNQVDAWQALHHFVAEAKKQVRHLPHCSLHLLVVVGLLAMYMSDHKVKLQGILSEARTLIKSAGFGSLSLYQLCRLTRHLKAVK